MFFHFVLSEFFPIRVTGFEHPRIDNLLSPCQSLGLLFYSPTSLHTPQRSVNAISGDQVFVPALFD